MLPYTTPPSGGGLYIIWLSDTHYYGGRARSFKVRWRDHFRSLRDGKHCNPYMQAVFNIHKQFLPQILQLSDSHENSTGLEQAWIDANLGREGCVNLNPHAHGGSGPRSEATKAKMRLKRHSPEAKQKMSEARKGRKLSDEGCANMSEGQKKSYANGRTMSPTSRQRSSDKQKGKSLTDEHRAHLSRAWEQRPPLTEETRQKLRASQQARRVQEAIMGRPPRPPTSEATRKKLQEAQKARRKREQAEP